MKIWYKIYQFIINVISWRDDRAILTTIVIVLNFSHINLCVIVGIKYLGPIRVYLLY